MAESKYTELFRFEVEGMDRDAFHVLSFRGTEALSSLFSFDIELVSKDMSLGLEELLASDAKLTIKRGGDLPDAVFAGRPAAARQTGSFGEYAYYSVTLRPAFWKFTQLVQSAIFLNKTAPETVDELISEERGFPLSFEMRLTAEYPKQEFAMQHEESVYDYIAWRMEQQGAYFYFAPDGDKVIFSDSPQSHDGPAGTIYYSPATGLEGDKTGEVATSFSLCQTPLPARVVVRSYSWKNPNVPIVAEADVSPRGFGDVYLAHEPAETHADAQRIAEIRAEELKCRSKIYSGVSASPLMRPGAVFTLDRHYNEKFNRDYMVTEVTHEGAQEAFISMGLGIPIRGAVEHLFYRNEFRCIESDTPYRPERKAPRAKITGVMRAFVDGAGSGARAETDEYGRYKLIFPFDISGRKGGNGSCWIRMSQQQAGPDSGLALPVQPGVEALVSFEEGDPDRPYISGVLASGETGSIYGSGNQNISGLRTAGGNQITINDEDNKQGISMMMPTGSGIMMSAGSSDLAVNATDTAVAATSTCSTDLAGVLKTNLCGFRSVTCSTSDPKSLTTWASTCSAVGTMCSDTLSTLSKAFSGDTSNILSWSAGGVKDAMLVLNLLLQTINMGMGAQSSYNMAMTVKDDSTATSLVQAKAGIPEMLGLVSSLLLRLYSAGIDTANAFAGEPAGYDEDGNELRYDKDLNKVSKAAAQRSYTTSSAAALLPELTSIIVTMIAACKQESKLGGISLNAVKENVNLNAGTTVTAHADGSILLHAGALPAAGAPLNNTPALAGTDGVHAALKSADIKGPAHWGVGLDAAHGIAEDVIDKDYNFLCTDQKVNLNAQRPKSIASISELIYDRSTDSVSISKRDRVDYADNRVIARGGSKGATMSLKQKQWLGYAPSDGEVRLGVVTGNYPTQADTVRDSEFSGMKSDHTGAILRYNNTSIVGVEDNHACISNDAASLDLNGDAATMEAGTVIIKTTSGRAHKLTIDNAGIHIDGLEVVGSKLSSGEPLHIDGQLIKIG
ncbi:type VI secretion system tip protein TssI/VgrG [uncultured Cloacibacillus sp.]|uniref:type VI secretion system Vgr family protein n=1 Tax=uncultured Cloacibacillus sp. TaxID=889794 RepID=UPI00320B686B